MATRKANNGVVLLSVYTRIYGYEIQFFCYHFCVESFKKPSNRISQPVSQSDRSHQESQQPILTHITIIFVILFTLQYRDGNLQKDQKRAYV